MPTFEQLDAITVDQLRATGATKWNRPDGAIGVFTAEMDFGTAPQILDAIHREVADASFGYLPERMRVQLQEATAAHLKERFDWQVPTEWVHELPDVIAALEAAISQYCRAGSAIIVPTPAYMPFLFVPQMLGRAVIEVPMLRDENNNYSYDLDGIDAAFKQGGGLLLHCAPHNPTGRVFNRDELLALADVVQANNGRVFSDEIWAPLTLNGNQHLPYAAVSQTAADHTVTAISASKTWNLPGLKCAQMVLSNPADERIWQLTGGLKSHGAANLGVVANAVAYGQAWDWRNDIVAYLTRNAQDFTAFVRQNLPRVRMPDPEGTYVAWLDFSAYDLPTTPQQYLLEKAGVMMTEGIKCGQVGANHTRFIFATPRPIMLQALERIADALNGV